MTSAQREALAALVPPDLVDAIKLALAADRRRVRASSTSMSLDEYGDVADEAVSAWLHVANQANDWLVAGDEPVIELDEREIGRLAAMSHDAAATSGKLAAALRPVALRVVGGGR